MNKITVMLTRAAAFSVLSAAFAAAPASASRLAVNFECNGNCSTTTLGQACDRYSFGAVPVAISCADTSTSPGLMIHQCGGSAECRSFGALRRSDTFGSYCLDGSGFDAVVTCEH